jgi:ribonuclease HI
MNGAGKPTRTAGSSIWVFCDGSTGAVESRPGGASAAQAPGTCGAAAVALDESGRIVGWDMRALPAMTNNEAEYAGLLLGIGLAQRLQAEKVVFLLDSEIVVGQMTGRFGVNSASLHRWNWQACEAIRSLTAVRFCAIPREWNRAADGLACQAGIPWAWLRRQVEQRT